MIIDRRVVKMKDVLAVGEVYHILNKSIAGFKIFNRDSEFTRMKDLFAYYTVKKPFLRFSYFSRLKYKERTALKNSFRSNLNKEKIVDIVAYCIMPTHVHLIIKQLKRNGISVFMSNVLNSYARYFNTKHKRKGPLWEGRFKRILIDTDEQLLHLTRYIHLNPVTAYLIDKPEEWPFSSYKEYILEENKKVCRYNEILDIKPVRYKRFVENNIDYQRKLAKIKHLILEEIDNK